MAVQDILYQLQSSGLYEIALPFLLIFTIVFAILEKTKIFGIKGNEPRSNINAVVSVILGLLIINQFEIVDRLNLFLPKVSLFIVVAIMFLILLGVFGANVGENGFSGILLLIFAIISLLVIYWALTPTIGLDTIGPYWLESWVYDNSSSLIAFVIIGIIIWAVVSKPKSGQHDSFEKFGTTIDKMFGKGGK